ncbi:MAG: hypothetical protein AABZ73_03015 [Pseudomonadota bacterium]|uniref:hypothetical protein n=1 Tax=Sphingobium sp. TaxID=1912891 RepID=UPI002E24FDAE
MAKQPKRTPGLELGVLLKRHFDHPPVPPPKNDRALPRWTTETFALAVGYSARVVRMWLKGERIPEDIDTIERVLFGDDLTPFKKQVDELRDVVTRCRYRRDEKEPLPESRSALVAPVIYSDPTADFAVLTYRDIDALPVDPDWRFDEAHYGEGVQKIAVPGRSLFWLPSAEQLTDANGERRALTDFFPAESDALDALSLQHHLFFPRRIVVHGMKRRDAVVRLYACTDQPYVNEDYRDDPEQFESEALLGLGGIAAFVNRDGSLRERSAGEMGKGLGCVVALVAVAYVHRRPRYRTPYCLMIRKGIRYPDDVWINPATGSPVWSGPEPLSSRFLFQSREAKGSSTDMFAADFNGARLFNLNEQDETAWDGFTDENGRDLVTWKENRVTMASLVEGNGFVGQITREDRNP